MLPHPKDTNLQGYVHVATNTVRFRLLIYWYVNAPLDVYLVTERKNSRKSLPTTQTKFFSFIIAYTSQDRKITYHIIKYVKPILIFYKNKAVFDGFINLFFTIKSHICCMAAFPFSPRERL